MLEVEKIITRRGVAEVLHKVSITVEASEVVCVVGRNGAGKTTLVESIIGLLPVRAGRIAFRGNEVTSQRADIRARQGIGYAPDNSGIFPDLSVSQNIMIGRWIAESVSSGNDSESSEDRIYKVFPEIREFEDRLGSNLSGGQKKMVAIARAMSLSPSLLLLDEAFEGLAPVIIERFTEAVKAIKDMGISLLLAESNLAAAAKIADRVYAIDRGEIIFHGTPEQVMGNDEVMRMIHG